MGQHSDGLLVEGRNPRLLLAENRNSEDAKKNFKMFSSTLPRKPMDFLPNMTHFGGSLILSQAAK